MSGNGISWAICKSAPRSRQITMPAPHHSVFYRLDALPAAQPTASKHWMPAKHEEKVLVESAKNASVPVSSRWPDTVSVCRRLQNVLTAPGDMSSACRAQQMPISLSNWMVQPRTSLTMHDCRPSSANNDSDRLRHRLDRPPATAAAAAAANISCQYLQHRQHPTCSLRFLSRIFSFRWLQCVCAWSHSKAGSVNSLWCYCCYFLGVYGSAYNSKTMSSRPDSLPNTNSKSHLASQTQNQHAASVTDRKCPKSPLAPTDFGTQCGDTFDCCWHHYIM